MVPLLAFLVCCFTLGSSCSQRVTCPCGSSNLTFTFCPSNATIENTEADICKAFSLCQECLDDLQHCAKCPHGSTGPTCSQIIPLDENSDDIPGIQELASYHPRYRPHVIMPEERISRKKRQNYVVLNVEERNGSCRALEAPQFGAMSCSQTGSYSVCTGRCLPGYTFRDMNGETEINLRCQRGSWIPMRYFPPCVAGSSCQLQVVGGGFFNCTIGMEGTRCDISCGDVYQGRYHCYPGRPWNPPLPYCVRPRGASSGRPPCACQNGGVCLTSMLNAGNDGGCLCPPGFTGQFCEREEASGVLCLDPGIPQGAERVNTDGTDASLQREFREGESVVYRCRNSLLEGDSLLTCRGDGTWTSNTPRCIPRSTTPAVTCPDPGLVENSNRRNMDGNISNDLQSYSPGQFVVYDCNRGYALHGSSMITCTRSGRWSDRRPYCTRIRPMSVTTTESPMFCREPGVMEYGEVLDAPAIDPLAPNERYPVRSEVRYGCLPGYEMEGFDVIYCMDGGRWSLSPPECIQRPRNNGDPSLDNLSTCRSLPRIENGRIVQTSILDPRRVPENYPAESEVTFTCNDGYSLVGKSTIYCRNTGEWSSATPICASIEPDINDSPVAYCTDPGPISNGVYEVVGRPRRPAVSEHPEGTRLRYSCDPPYILRGKSEITCEKTSSWSENPPSCVQDCGRPLIFTRHRITHGQITHPGEWPWVVAVAIRKRNRTNVICGGALVNRNTILTAAHCVTREPKYSLYFGKFHLLTELDDAEVRVRSSRRILLHPDYNESSYFSDIALVQFYPSIRYTERIRPVCLPTKATSEIDLQPNSDGYVTGWGVTEINARSEILLVASLPVQPTDKCIRSYESFNYPNRILHGMFCAGPDDGEVSACLGDSGSPLVFYNQDYKQYTIEGIVSFSIPGKCGQAGLYSVFTKVYDFINWISINIR